MTKKIFTILLKFKLFKKLFTSLIYFYFKNIQGNSSNTYDLEIIKRIGTAEGNFSANKIIKFLKNNCSLSNSNFLDVGCGDLFIYPLLSNFKLKKYYGFDMNNDNISNGIQYLKKNNINTKNIIIEQGDYFNFKKIKKNSIDIIFCHSVCSHLHINSLMLMFKNLRLVAKNNCIFFCSFIALDNEKHNVEPKEILWNQNNSFKNKKYELKTYFLKNPYHYNFSTIEDVANICGWDVKHFLNYEHDVQKMFIFKKKNQIKNI